VMMVNLVNLFVGVAVCAPATTAPERSTARSHAALQNLRPQEKGSPGSPRKRKLFSRSRLNVVNPWSAGVHHTRQKVHHPRGRDLHADGSSAALNCAGRPIRGRFAVGGAPLWADRRAVPEGSRRPNGRASVAGSRRGT